MRPFSQVSPHGTGDPSPGDGPSRVFLFDVDGTLIRAGGAGRDAFLRTWERVFEVPHAFDRFSFAGCTDGAILARGFREAMGRDITPGERDRFFQVYLDLLPGLVAEATHYRVLPGIREVLETLSERPDCQVGLCTGNLERGARAKLARGDLNRFFRFGGFGSDSDDRGVLTAIAARRAREIAGRDVEVTVIGDSPRDLEAARANGFRSVLVATGFHDLKTLAALAPDLLFPSFADVPEVLSRLLGPQTAPTEAPT